MPVFPLRNSRKKHFLVVQYNTANRALEDNDWPLEVRCRASQQVLPNIHIGSPATGPRATLPPGHMFHNNFVHSFGTLHVIKENIIFNTRDSKLDLR